MPIITKLKSQKNKNRVNVFLDGKFSFGLSLDEVLKNKLSKGMELGSEFLEELYFQSQFEILYQKVLNFLSYRPRSEKEVIDYLKKRLYKLKKSAPGLENKAMDKVLKKLYKNNLLDDMQFARWWVEQRLNFKHKGKGMIKLELYKKGIDRKIVEKVLARIDDAKLKSMAQAITGKKIKLYNKLPEFKLKKKLYEHLKRRGFSYKIIKSVIDEALEK
jgi:regulatory protein